MINLMLKGSLTLSENITRINLFLITFSKEMQPQKMKRHEQVAEKVFCKKEVI
jgi:hypothetical protein